MVIGAEFSFSVCRELLAGAGERCLAFHRGTSRVEFHLMCYPIRCKTKFDLEVQRFNLARCRAADRKSVV